MKHSRDIRKKVQIILKCDKYKGMPCNIDNKTNMYINIEIYKFMYTYKPIYLICEGVKFKSIFQ